MIDCHKVIVKDAGVKGLGAFAKYKIKKNELVEKGVMVPIDIDGHKNTHVFTWSDDKKIWAFGSGCSTFYNTSKSPNCEMRRFYDLNRFEIYALEDISEGDELTHRYQSLEWRDAFKNLNKEL